MEFASGKELFFVFCFCGDEMWLAGVDGEGDFVMGDGVFPRGEEREVGGFFGGALGELPHAFAAGAGFVGEEERAVFFAAEEDVLIDRNGGAAWFFLGKVCGSGCLAEVFDGAEEAAWFASGTDGLSELHEGGVECAWGALIDELVGVVPDELLSFFGIDGGGDVEETGEDAGDIGIDDGGGAVEG